MLYHNCVCVLLFIGGKVAGYFSMCLNKTRRRKTKSRICRNSFWDRPLSLIKNTRHYYLILDGSYTYCSKAKGIGADGKQNRTMWPILAIGAPVLGEEEEGEKKQQQKTKTVKKCFQWNVNQCETVPLMLTLSGYSILRNPCMCTMTPVTVFFLIPQV